MSEPKETLFLYHETSLKSLRGIYEKQKLVPSGYLSTKEYSGFTVRGNDEELNIINYTGDSFGGVYFGLGCDLMIDKQITYYGDVCLIFSSSLLSREDYHVNLQNTNGRITKDTFSSRVLHENTDLPIYSECDSMGEVVFHNEVSFEYCIAIFVPNKNILTSLQHLNLDIPISIVKKFPKMDYQVVEIEDIQGYKPNFIFFPKPIRGDIFTDLKVGFLKDKYIFDPDIYMAMLINCGYDHILDTKSYIYFFTEEYLKGNYLKKGISFDNKFLLKVYDEIKCRYLQEFSSMRDHPYPFLFPPFKRGEILDFLAQ